MTTDNSTKICKDCKQEKLVDYFVVNRNTCLQCNIIKRNSSEKILSEETRLKKKELYQQKKEEYKKAGLAYRCSDRGIKTELLRHARNRAKKSGREFELTISDIDTLPEYCPVLGIKMTKGIGKTHHESYTIDRIDSNKGYTPDNIQIISARANMLKSNATIEELQSVLDWMKQNSKNC